MEFKIMVLAMLVQRQTGGNLAELLDKLSRVMRQRVEMKGMIRRDDRRGPDASRFVADHAVRHMVYLVLVNRNYALKLLTIRLNCGHRQPHGDRYAMDSKNRKL